jgi:hypothetical protein
MQQNEILDTPFLDPNYDSYEQFFDYQWADAILKRAINSPLKKPVIDFVLSCRYASEAHRLPWLSVELLRSYAEGERQAFFGVRRAYAEQVINGVVQRIAKKMDRHLNHDSRSALRRVVKEIEKETFGATRSARIKFNKAAYWQYMTDPKRDTTGIFPMSIFGIQRNNYLALYFAFEDLSLHVIRTKKPKFKANPTKGVTIGGALDDLFGGALGKETWDDEIDLARLVRNQLVHSGGRYDPAKFDKYKARIVDQKSSPLAPVLKGELYIVVGDKIRITPCNGRHLFNVLKDRALKMVDKAV